MENVKAFKLVHVRADGTYGPLFIDRKLVLRFGVWMKAKAVNTKGFKFRPGWHACSEPIAPHLSKEGRAWMRVSLRGVQEHHRPKSQGGLWYTAKQMRIDGFL
jgi:hypothetical protein